MKKILKLSIPGAPPSSSLNAFKDSDNPLINDWDIFVNDPSLRKADCWFVVEDLPDFDKICDVPPENIIFLAAETAQPVSYIEESRSMKLFLSQFGKIFTFHQYIDSRTTSAIPFLPWMINSNHGDSIWAEHERNVEFFKHMAPPEKNKIISVICSKQDLTENHRMRVRFVEQLKNHFGAALDWYGNGVDSVPEKWDALAPYRYTIVLENQKRFNVLTEKIGDAYLAHCYPIYWGAPNISDFFPDGSYSVVNIENFSGSIKEIEKTISGNYAELNHDQISESRRLVLSELNFVNRILRIACTLEGVDSKKVVLASQEETRMNPKSSNFFYNSVIAKLNKLDEFTNTNFVDILKGFYILFRYNKVSQLLINKIRARK